MISSELVVTCAPRLVPYVKMEIEALGYRVSAEDKMSVQLFGTLEDAMRLNLELRTASKVLFLINKFKAGNPDMLYKALFEIPWERMIHANGYISIDGYIKNDHILDTRYALLKTKDAIVDRIANKRGRRPDAGNNPDKTALFIHWVNDDVAIYFNTSGAPISKHGYRINPFKAPVQESLASAIIMASNWDRKSPFINPMCGSGTLAIEAALMFKNEPPGLKRNNFGFMHIKSYDPEKWIALRKKYYKQPELTPPPIIATDIHQGALNAARENAERAGVLDLIQFERCDFRKTPIPSPGNNGVVVLNPEYGERLGDSRELESIYTAIGDFFKSDCSGYTGYVFTGNLDLAKKIGLRTKQRIEFYNGKIDCRLLVYELYRGSKKKV